MTEPTSVRKAIPPARDRLQSRLLVACVTPVLLAFAARDWWSAMHITADPAVIPVNPEDRKIALIALLISLLFAAAVWALRAATPGAAAVGGTVCLLVTVRPGVWSGSILRSGLPPLFALFVLTFVATRAGRPRKAALGLAERRRGRNAAQVIANLGMAGLVVVAGFPGGLLHALQYLGPGRLFHAFNLYALDTPLCLLAVLCEATADTVASEIGQAFGGTPYLLPAFRPVPAGTDGAISLRGTLAGLLAAAAIAAAGAWSLELKPIGMLLALSAGIAGLLADSLLGALVERRGWLGNDLVNFLSTVSAAVLVLLFAAACLLCLKWRLLRSLP